MQISARNQISGTIVAIEKGAVNTAVSLRVSDEIHIVANITMDAVKDLDLAVGDTVKAIIKASDVMIGK